MVAVLVGQHVGLDERRRWAAELALEHVGEEGRCRGRCSGRWGSRTGPVSEVAAPQPVLVAPVKVTSDCSGSKATSACSGRARLQKSTSEFSTATRAQSAFALASAPVLQPV